MMLALHGGAIHPVRGKPLARGTVLVGDDGRIAKIGADLKPPKGCAVLDCSGATVYPGFVEAHCHLGLDREGVGYGNDGANECTSPFTPGVRAVDGVDVHDMAFVKSLFEGGVTAANVSPGSANIIGGSTDVISVAPARHPEQLLIRRNVALKMAFGENPFRVYGSQKKSPTTRMAVASVLRDYLNAVRNYMGRRKEALKAKKHFDKNLDHEIVAGLLERKIIAHCHAHEAFDIMTAVRSAKENGYEVVIVHGTGAADILDELKGAKVNLIIGPQSSFSAKLENRFKTLGLARKLHEAGLKFAISTDHPVICLRDLRIEAARMVNKGLPTETALEALTINPAEILGLERELGSIEPGKRADLIVWDGHPLDVAHGRVRHAVVGGRPVAPPPRPDLDWWEYGVKA